MILVFFALWVVLNGRLTWEVTWLGVLASGALYAFCCAFLEYSPQKDLTALRRVPRMLRYGGLVVKEIVKSNMALTRIVLNRQAEVKPQLVTFKTPLSGQVAKAVLADSITVTPGTITVLAEGDELTIHCLDTGFAQGIEDSDFQKQLLGLQWEGKTAKGGKRP